VLTLDEVRQAGLLAWHPTHHYLYSDGHLLRVVLAHSPGIERPASVSMNLRRSTLHGSEQHIQTGWHHLEDCDCRFCQVAKAAGEQKTNGRGHRDGG
jgi:hypothetical protein